MKSTKIAVDKSWLVYLLRCRDKTIYTGITNNIEKRLAAHNNGMGAKYTKSRRPVKVLALSKGMPKSKAMQLEIKIKKQPKEKKLAALKLMG
jgi:putative endonuclease